MTIRHALRITALLSILVVAPQATYGQGGAYVPPTGVPVDQASQPGVTGGALPAGTALPVAAAPANAETDMSSQSIFSRALQGGLIVFACLSILVGMSVVTWAIVVSKYVYLMRVQKTSDAFIKSFWDSRSLNDLNGRLGEYPYSPVREVFRSGYAELVRGSQLREQAQHQELAVNAALDNLNRALGKAKVFERRRLERFVSVLAISASVSPFIGLFGTVWGIMGAFEGIARTGSASLAAVAPGISEALIATAFGLAAAIPAVVGYNLFAGRIRTLMAHIDGFSVDFLNIVERYLVTDKPRGGHSTGAPAPSATQSPIDGRI